MEGESKIRPKLIGSRQVEKFMEDKYADDNSKCYITELRLGTGYENEQRLDGFLMELWPSKNYEITAYEIKISRPDFQRELRNPKKKMAGMEISNRFYFITANKIVNDVSEIPEDCGWLEFTGARLIERKKAPTRVKPESCPWTLVASLFRRSDQLVKQSKVLITRVQETFNDLMEA